MNLAKGATAALAATALIQPTSANKIQTDFTDTVHKMQATLHNAQRHIPASPDLVTFPVPQKDAWRYDTSEFSFKPSAAINQLLAFARYGDDVSATQKSALQIVGEHAIQSAALQALEKHVERASILRHQGETKAEKNFSLVSIVDQMIDDTLFLKSSLVDGDVIKSVIDLEKIFHNYRMENDISNQLKKVRALTHALFMNNRGKPLPPKEHAYLSREISNIKEDHHNKDLKDGISYAAAQVVSFAGRKAIGFIADKLQDLRE